MLQTKVRLVEEKYRIEPLLLPLSTGASWEDSRELLLEERPIETLERMHRIDLDADELAALRIRRELEALDYDFDQETVELLKLTATELVTNSTRHSGTDRVVVFVRVDEPSLLIKVCDRGPGVDTKIKEPEPFAEGGRGLFLVESLTHSWGTSQLDIDGSQWSCVWACFGAEALPECASA